MRRGSRVENSGISLGCRSGLQNMTGGRGAQGWGLGLGRVSRVSRVSRVENSRISLGCRTGLHIKWLNVRQPIGHGLVCKIFLGTKSGPEPVVSPNS